MLSDYFAQQYVPTQKTALIRLYQEKESELLDMNEELYASVLRFKVADVHFLNNYQDMKVLFDNPKSNFEELTEDKRKKFIQYLDTISDCGELVIHCMAGVSRSPSFGIISSWYLNTLQEEKELIKELLPSESMGSYFLNLFAKDLTISRPYLGFDYETSYNEFQQALEQFSKS